jgi:tartrate-resistant acid phosphatase type 5
MVQFGNMAIDPDQIERLQRFSQDVWAGRQRGMSRRQFLAHGLRLGLSLPAISAVLVGCGAEPTVSRWTPMATAQIKPAPPAAAVAQPVSTPISTQPPAPPAPTATTVPRTELPAPALVRFAVIGDFGMVGLAAERVAALVASWAPDFVVTTGDNNYPAGAADTIDANVGQYYHQFMAHSGSAYGPAAAENRFFPVLGNHDADINGVAPYMEYFVLPGNERYYTVERPPVRIYALNSVPWIEPDGAHPESRQAEWLRNELAASHDTWNVVVFHHPPYSSHHRGMAEWMRWPFREWGADVALCGHNHVYERVEVEGFTYLVNGLGGGARYAWGPIVPGSLVRYNADHGAMLVEASPERITFQFIVATSGEVVDTYTVSR